MFSEYLDRHPIQTLLTAFPPPFPPASDRRAWESVAPEDREALRRLAAQYAPLPYPLRRASDFLAFTRSGSRQADEKPYFFRRRKLCVSALQCCVDETADPDAVIDGIWCVCEETSWVISAHNVNPIPGAPAPADYPLPDGDRPYVDLFSAQTAMILALTAHLLKDRLDAVSPMLRARAEKEIRRRVLSPFLERDDFWWMGVQRQDLNNWTPWITSNILWTACALPLEKNELAAVADRCLRILDRWLAVVPADGGCDEGAGYWNMAGGALLDCLDVLERITGGRMTFWQEEKLRNILAFPVKAEIGNGWFVNFADCDARPFLSGERLQWAGERLGDPALAALGCRVRGTLQDQLNDVPHFTRLLSMLFHPAAQVQAVPAGDAWLPDLQLRLVRRGEWTLCCKGGHNGESHNHNDVGSFMLYRDGQPLIVDAGNRVYTALTFSDARYTLWNVRSAYHNLPLIGDKEQQPGAAFAARDVSCLSNGLKLDLAAAYGPEAGVRTLERELRLTDTGLTLADRVSLSSPQIITWVFLLRHQPRTGRDHLLSGGVRLDFPSGWSVDAEELPIGDTRMARSFPGSLWRVLIACPAQAETRAVFTVRAEKH